VNELKAHSPQKKSSLPSLLKSQSKTFFRSFQRLNHLGTSLCDEQKKEANLRVSQRRRKEKNANEILEYPGSFFLLYSSAAAPAAISKFPWE